MLNHQPIEKVQRTFDGTLQVHSIFKTIQGEGPFCGVPAVFIRLAGCNLQCPWCFVGNTQITMADGSRKPIEDIREGEMVLAYDEHTGTFTPRRVLRTMSRLADDLYRIETAKRRTPNQPPSNLTDRLLTTGEHPFLVRGRGWVLARDLRPGDVLVHLSTSERMKACNPVKKDEVREQISNTLKSKHAKGELTGYIPSPEAREIWSAKMRGDRNPMADPATAARQHMARKDVEPNGSEQWFMKVCDGLSLRYWGNSDHIGYRFPDFWVPGTNKVIEVWDHSSEHGQERQRNGYAESRKAHFAKHGYDCLCISFARAAKGEADRVRREVAEFIHNGETVERLDRIQPLNGKGIKAWVNIHGRQGNQVRVYNLEVEGLHTYVANGKVVHNCDTEYTEGRRDMTIVEILAAVYRLIDQTQIRLIVITGGEPFRQPLAKLLTAITWKDHLYVQIETNGTLPLPRDYRDWSYQPSEKQGVYIVCSPKTGKVHPTVADAACCYKYVLTAGDIAEDDGLPLHALGHVANPRLARPTEGFPGPVYVQPADLKDGHLNRANMLAAVASAKKFGYTVQLQIHKYLNLE